MGGKLKADVNENINTLGEAYGSGSERSDEMKYSWSLVKKCSMRFVEGKWIHNKDNCQSMFHDLANPRIYI